MTMPIQTVPNRSGVCQWCGRPFTPYPRRAAVQRFCSESCRVWAYKHLCLPAPEVGPKPSGWTQAQRELSAHLQRRESRKARMLARLQQGPATTWELMQLGGSGFSSRLTELKRENHRIVCENHLDGAVYRLEVP